MKIWKFHTGYFLTEIRIEHCTRHVLRCSGSIYELGEPTSGGIDTANDLSEMETSFVDF